MHARSVHARGKGTEDALESSAVANALAALAVSAGDETDVVPHLYFEWTEGNPIANLLRFLMLGVGEVARSPGR